MKNIEILAVGTHPEIMKTILRLLNSKPGWHGALALSAEDAIAQSKLTSFDIILACAGLGVDETKQIQTSFNVPIVQHYGGGSGLLYAEVCEALKIALP
jgi:hypothetical protein